MPTYKPTAVTSKEGINFVRSVVESGGYDSKADAVSGCSAWSVGELPAVVESCGRMVTGASSVSAAQQSGTARVLPNPSFKPSTSSVAPGPGWRYAVHFRHPGPRVTPLVPS